MMRHPERWSNLILPLKHSSREDSCGLRLLGFMFEDTRKRQAKPVVYLGCIFFGSMGLKLEDLAVEEFSDLDAVVAAGWRVD